MTYISSVLGQQDYSFLNEVYKNHLKIANIIFCYLKKSINLIQLKHSQTWM